MKHFYYCGQEITEDEAEKIEAGNREILREGTIEELLKINYVECKEF